MRRPAVALAVLAIAACSGSEAGTEPSAVPETTVSVTTPVSTVMVDESVDVEPVDPASVRIDVSVGGIGAELTGLLSESGDPFEQFVSCSGLRTSFGTYSVLASSTAGDVRAISVISADRVSEPGVYDAAVRVEFASDRAVDASGTVTLAADWRSGEFIAFDLDGATVQGSFECPGGNVLPEPMEPGDTDGVLESVEVFALLRQNESQRIVGLSTLVDGGASVECPGANDDATNGAAADELVVRVDGDHSLGAITMFELTGGPAPSVRMRVGSVPYEFDRVVREGAGGSPAGTFSAESDRLIVDGAFRCS